MKAGSSTRPGLCLVACAAFALGDVPTAEVVRRDKPPNPSAVVVVGIGSATSGPQALYLGVGWAPWADAARGFVRYVRPGHGRPTGGLPTPPDARPLGLLPPS